MIDTLIQRAQQLVQTGRYREAEKELRNVLSQDPNRPEALAMLAICRSAQGSEDEALKIISDAIRNEPDNDYFLYLQALFFLRKSNASESEKAIRNAIAFNPANAEYFGLLANIKLAQKDWQQALKFADEGLEKDPNNLLCLNSRSTALFKLERKEAAHDTIREALSQDPHNDQTHANIGWSLLEHGDYKQALEHFREALKINPNHGYAKAGLVEALKARYWFYRMFLKYAFWLHNRKAKGQWAVIIGLYIGVRVLNGIAKTDETLGMFITPLVYLYFVFALSTWIIEPLSNLFLRLNVYGRYALTRSETQSSNFVGISLAVGLLGGVMFLITGNLTGVLTMIFGVTMMIPLASMFNPRKPGNKKMLIAYTIFLGVIGLVEILQSTQSDHDTILSSLYIFGMIAYQWIANLLTIR